MALKLAVKTINNTTATMKMHITKNIYVYLSWIEAEIFIPNGDVVLFEIFTTFRKETFTFTYRKW